MNRERIKERLEILQDSICEKLEIMDGKSSFQEEKWLRPGGGGGRTRVIAGGDVFEKGGVNFSEVFGEMSPELVQSMLGLQSKEISELPQFYASGVSIVIHPKSPMVPITHMNVRYFEMSDGRWWFGGGIDLTPIYVDIQLAKNFHGKMKEVCDHFHEDFYPLFKKQCDDYFYIPHRKEMRGIGGIFFDALHAESQFGKKYSLSKETLLDFIIAVGNTFPEAYAPQVEHGRLIPYGDAELEWQQIRRSRYAEFNLVWDRGTKFGLQTDGRTESILMSMPPTCSWPYQYQVKPGSKEEKCLAFYQKGIDWLSY